MALAVSEGHHHEKIIDNGIYELINVDMEGMIVRGFGLPFEKISEGLIGDPPFKEKVEAEAFHGNVPGVRLTHKVEAPWDEDTGWAITRQFGGVFQELAEVSEISSCVVAYPD